MKKDFSKLDPFRAQVPGWEKTVPGQKEGAFVIPHNGLLICCIISDQMNWDHVSVSLRSKDQTKMIKRTPTWEEMEFVKRLFFEPDEVAVQYHVREDDHINVHDYVLHLWRGQQINYIMPPKIMV